MSSELEIAIEAAETAGAFLREKGREPKVVDESSQHDIKLRLDVESQDLIEKILLGNSPNYAFYGEEGLAGDAESEDQWIVDPIDGTVNFFYGIPHYCVSIALRTAGKIRLGVIHDPSVGETWTAVEGGPCQLNGETVRISDRAALKESAVTIGFSRTAEAGEAGMRRFAEVSRKVRKCRMMGSAALSMAYIASGRLDAYVEEEISLWDIAAGHLLIEAAGGRVDLRPREEAPDTFRIIASNGLIHDEISSLCL